MPTGNYKVKFSGPYGSNLAYQWYDNQAAFSQASWVPVVVGSTTANINAQLIVGGTITGLTTTGTVLPAGINATVNVYDEYRNKVASWPSSSNGTFSVAGLPTGRYKVEFFGYNLGGPLGSTWFNGHRTFDSAEWIWVNAGSTTPDVNGHLVPAVIISGKVTDTLGAAISKVTVRVYDDATLGQLNPYDGTDSFGNFTVKNISPGSSRLYYDSFGTGFFPGWWDGKKMITEATPIDLISGQTYPNKDAVLDPSKEVYLPLILKN